jgi:hypothetical protein
MTFGTRTTLEIGHVRCDRFNGLVIRGWAVGANSTVCKFVNASDGINSMVWQLRMRPLGTIQSVGHLSLVTLGPIQWFGHSWVGARWGKFNGLQISGWFIVRSCMDVAICGWR